MDCLFPYTNNLRGDNLPGIPFADDAEYAGPVTALVITSLLFGVVHGANENFNFIGLINIILAGLVLGVLVLRTGRIWAASGLHFKAVPISA